MKNNLALLLSLAVACSPMHGSLDETDTLFPHHYRTDGYSSEETRETSGLYDAGKRGSAIISLVTSQSWPDDAADKCGGYYRLAFKQTLKKS